MKVKLILALLFVLLLSFLLIQSITSNTSLNSNECNSCHGPGSTGHVVYTVSLGISQTILNGTSSVLTATISNTGYQLSTSSLALQTSSDYSFSPVSTADSLTKSLGTLNTGSTSTVSWNVIPNVSTNKTITFQVNFQGTAINHKTFAYTSSYSKSVYVSTIKMALLEVSSTPVSQSTFLTGDTISNDSLTIANAGVLTMTNVEINTTGTILINNQSSFIIPSISPNSSLHFPIELNSSVAGINTITILYLNSTPLQEVIITITIQPVPPTSIWLIIGSILGYVSYILLFLSVVSGAGIYHLKKYISGIKIRILHSDLSNLSFTMVVIHGVVLSLPSSPWFGTYTIFQLLPQILPVPVAPSDIGFEIGRWALVLLYVGVMSGYFIAQLIKRYGRKVGISIHMLTYIALILGFIHTIMVGVFAQTFIIIPIAMFISILSIGWLKYDTKLQLERKKAERKQRFLAKDIAELQTKSKADTPIGGSIMNATTQPSIVKNEKIVMKAAQPRINQQQNQSSVEELKKRLLQEMEMNMLSCPNCSTKNPLDSNFCRKCGTYLMNK